MRKKRRVRRVPLMRGYVITWAGAYSTTTMKDYEERWPDHVWKMDPMFSGQRVTLVAEVEEPAERQRR